MLKILIAAPEGLYPGCPFDITAETKRFFKTEHADTIVSLRPEELERCDGMVIPGGVPDVDPIYWNEERNQKTLVDKSWDEQQMNMLERAVGLRKPILGICRGHQLASVYFGATLSQDIARCDVHKYEEGKPKFHAGHVIPGTFMESVYGSVIEVNSAHHQAIKKLPDCLRPALIWCSDEKKAEAYIQKAEAGELCEGNDECVIEAVYHRDYPFIGLQWHPELGGEDFYCQKADPVKIRNHFYEMMIENSKK